MKITLQQTDGDEDEVIIRYREITPKISEAIKIFSGSGRRLAGTEEGKNQTHCFAPEKAYYYESVDGATYAYLEEHVYRIRERLDEILCQYEDLGIIRCARTMAVNLYRVEWLQSQPGGRILATLQNGEKIIISRKYAGLLRRKLQKGQKGK